MNQQRHDTNPVSKRGLQFEPDEIVRAVQATDTVLSGGREPRTSDHDKEHVRSAQRITNRSDKVMPRLDAIDINKHTRSAQHRNQAVGQPPRVASGVLAAVADEYRGGLLDANDCASRQIRASRQHMLGAGIKLTVPPNVRVRWRQRVMVLR